MIVEAIGHDARDRHVRAVWTLAAGAGHGPWIPTLPALALAKKLLANRTAIPPGARSAVKLLTLAEIAAEFSRFNISTQITHQMLDPPR
jgi:hypothetical protein